MKARIRIKKGTVVDRKDYKPGAEVVTDWSTAAYLAHFKKADILATLEDDGETVIDEYGVPSVDPDALREPEVSVLIGSDQLPAEVSVSDGVVLAAGDVVRSAFELSGLSAAEWNALDGERRDVLIMARLDEIRQAEAEVNPPARPESHEELIAAIRAAVDELDPENPEHWNQDGKTPAVSALEHVLGYDVSAAERDEAIAPGKSGGE